MSRSPEEAVRHLWDRFEARDFDGAGDALADDVVIDWPATRERIRGRRNVVELNRAYPEPWGHITIAEVIAAGTRVAARVRIDAPEAVVHALGFYETRDGVIASAIEYWVDEGASTPASDRAAWTEPLT